MRPLGWTSGDAAGLPILPGLVRRDDSPDVVRPAVAVPDVIDGPSELEWRHQERNRPGGSAGSSQRIDAHNDAAMRELSGKTAFITGGAGGIGFGMARAFTAEGMNVALADLGEADLTQLPDGSAMNVRCDVTDLESVRSAVAAVT